MSRPNVGKRTLDDRLGGSEDHSTSENRVLVLVSYRARLRVAIASYFKRFGVGTQADGLGQVSVSVVMHR